MRRASTGHRVALGMGVVVTVLGVGLLLWGKWLDHEGRQCGDAREAHQKAWNEFVQTLYVEAQRASRAGDLEDFRQWTGYQTVFRPNPIPDDSELMRLEKRLPDLPDAYRNVAPISSTRQAVERCRDVDEFRVR